VQDTITLELLVSEVGVQTGVPAGGVLPVIVYAAVKILPFVSPAFVARIFTVAVALTTKVEVVENSSAQGSHVPCVDAVGVDPSSV
jgi:hypothetical protein